MRDGDGLQFGMYLGVATIEKLRDTVKGLTGRTRRRGDHVIFTGGFSFVLACPRPANLPRMLPYFYYFRPRLSSLHLTICTITTSL